MPENWRNPDDYSYTGQLTLRQWAWEFLRRSRRYRETWAAATEQLEKVFEGKQPGDQVEMPSNLFWSGAEFGLWGHVPAPEARADRVGDLKWGLGYMRVDPRQLAGNPTIVTLGFNLLLPLEAQLKAADETLRDLRKQLDDAGYPPLKQTKTVRIRRDRWTTYLRLLDAWNVGESIAEMGRVLFGDKGDPRGSAQDALQRAKSMSDLGYFQLILKEENPKRGEGETSEPR